jgi:hypothetical protein
LDARLAQPMAATTSPQLASSVSRALLPVERRCAFLLSVPS